MCVCVRNSMRCYVEIAAAATAAAAMPVVRGRKRMCACVCACKSMRCCVEIAAAATAATAMPAV